MHNANISFSMENKITIENYENFVLVHQSEGPTLGFCPTSGVKIIYRYGFAFKSFDGSDTLLPYEDWRLPAEVRAEDLSRRLSIDEIAGLMLYSRQNKLPMPDDTYSGKPFAESGKKASDLSDGQLQFLLEDNVRHVLVSSVQSPEVAAKWNNNVQSLIEGRNHGIPANNSSDPRHSAFEDAEFSPGAGGQLSLWSNLMGLASTFDPELVKKFGYIASAEYRALGLATALSPQADLGTDPRWYRYNATFGCDPLLVSDLTKAYCEGFQSNSEKDSDWGTGSVNTMVKHWPGGGSGEGGRDAHYGNGKFAVYPGGCFEQHKYPFVHGAFNLDGKTKQASAVMPYYTISYDQTEENVGNSYNKELITHQLREGVGYDGVICTDWVITADQIDPGTHSGKPWGVEKMTVAERHFKALEAGVDQFGGNNEKGPVIEAYKMGCDKYGEKAMRARMERSARRLLVNSFRPGLFENPYVVVEDTCRTVGNPEWMKAGYEQQVKSAIMLKNHNSILPLKKGLKVYVPQRHLPDIRTYWGSIEPAKDVTPVAKNLAEKYYTPVDKPEEADCAIVFIDSPKSYRMGYDPEDLKKGGNGYIPITLQYRPYTATEARAASIATDLKEPIHDRSYKGKTAYAQNECDLNMLIEVHKQMAGKPVIVVIAMSNPMVLKEVEPIADAILTGFSLQTQVFLDLIFGDREPSGLLPFELPLSMSAIEHHCEDKPHDIEPYCDADGNIYKFTYGLNFTGQISDERTVKYSLKK